MAWHGLMPVVVGSPFGSPASLVLLTFNNPNGGLKLATVPGQNRPRGAIDDGVPDVQPRGAPGPARLTAGRHADRSTSGGIAVAWSAGYGGGMTVQPTSDPHQDEPYEVIHLGGEAAAIVPLSELRRLQAVERRAPAELLEEAEIEATLTAHREWVAAGRPGAVSHDEAMAELLSSQ